MDSLGVRVDQWPQDEQDQDLLEQGWSVKLSPELVSVEDNQWRYQWVYDHPVDNHLEGALNRSMARKLAGLYPRLVRNSDLDNFTSVLARRRLEFALNPSPEGYVLTVGSTDFHFNDNFTLMRISSHG